jgi:diguanylate cyclase
MTDQLQRGLPPIDDEYQGPSWWHLSRLGDVGRNPGMRRIAALGGLILAVSMVTGILNVTWDWNGIPVRLGPVEVPVTVYPPFVLSLLAAVWLGPTWGLVPAYTANLAGALVAGLGPTTSLLFALAGALEVLIFWGSMVTLNISPELRRGRDFARFFLVCIIAPITASPAVLIWNTAQGLDTTQGLRVWRRSCASPDRGRGPGSTASSPPLLATR